jgi:cytoskeletal protein CcmA (bactofilin family)
MKKILQTLLYTILFLLLFLSVVLAFAFSQKGNTLLKEYIQTELDSRLPMPTEVRKFTLDSKNARLILRLNGGLDVEIVSQYNLFRHSFSGIYHLWTDTFKYEKIVLKDANIHGDFSGTLENLHIHGSGKVWNAHVAYTLQLVNQTFQNIEAKFQGVSLSELLEFSSQPPLAEGKIDVDLSLPDIGKEFAKGKGNIVLHHAKFNTDVVQKVYGLVLPKKSYVKGNIDLALSGKLLSFSLKSKGNLFDLKLDNALYHLEEQRVTSDYFMDVKEMGILSQNRLSGALKVVGDINYSKALYSIKGTTNSLGGVIDFDVSKQLKFHLSKVNIAKMLHLLKQPMYAKGIVNASVDMQRDFTQGHYAIDIEKGLLYAKKVNAISEYKIPNDTPFRVKIKGTLEDKICKAQVKLHSSLSDIKAQNIVYDIEKNKLLSDYDVFIPNIGIFMSKNTELKRGYMSLKGELQWEKYLKIKGSVKGLGDTLVFDYDSKKASVDAEALFVEKLLSLLALPHYVKGKLFTRLNIQNIETLEGDFLFKSTDLLTQPHVMKTLIGKALRLNIALESKGKLRKHKAYVESKMTTKMGELLLSDTLFDIEKNQVSSHYLLNIPKLEKCTELFEQKLYGTLILDGEFTHKEVLKSKGKTTSLGGEITYVLESEHIQSKFHNVPIENMLHMSGHTSIVHGHTNGTMRYNTMTKRGIVDLQINDFKIKPSSTTQTLKMFIGKDPSRIIFSSTKLHATLNKHITTYSLHAKGHHASIDISQGKLNKKENTHRAKFKFHYEKYTVKGEIQGSIDTPSIVIDASSLMQGKVKDKIQIKLNKALGRDLGKTVTGFLEGLKI